MNRWTTSPGHFEGIPVYLGIDVHLKRWGVSRHSTGLDLETFSMNPSLEKLSEHLQRHYSGVRYLSVCETGPCGYWIDKRLTRLGNRPPRGTSGRCADLEQGAPWQVRQTRQKKPTRERESRSLEPVYVLSSTVQQLRTLSRLRLHQAGHQTQLKKRIQSMMAFYGYPLSRRDEVCHWTAKFIRHLNGLDLSEEIGCECLDYYLDELEDTRRRQTQVLKSIESPCTRARDLQLG